MLKKLIIIALLLSPLALLFYTDAAGFAFVKSIRMKGLNSYVRMINWFGDGGVLLLVCVGIYAWGHAMQWDLNGRKEALMEVVRAPLNRKGKSWKEWINDILAKLNLFLQSPLERAAFHGALALVIAGTLTRFLKFAIGRPRPSAAARGIENWGPSLTQHFDSFPSGHSTTAFAFATALAYHYPVLIPPLFIMGTLVALARVYLGHHYFADVYGGALIGILGGILAQKVLKAMEATGGAETDAPESQDQ